MAYPKKKFAKLYDKYVEKIYRFVFLKVSSQEEAEDLTSQVFTKGWKRISNIKNQKAKIKNVPAYLYQIARAEIANHHREKAKFQITNAISDQIIDPNPGPEETQELQSELEILKKTLPQLKDDYQNVVIWRYLEGLSVKNIAQMMEKPEGTVRVMVYRALKELRKKMENL